MRGKTAKFLRSYGSHARLSKAERRRFKKAWTKTRPVARRHAKAFLSHVMERGSRDDARMVVERLVSGGAR